MALPELGFLLTMGYNLLQLILQIVNQLDVITFFLTRNSLQP